MIIFLTALFTGSLVLFVMLLLGGDHEMGVDHDFDHGGDLGHPNVLSIRVISAAVTGWGASGFIARYFGSTMFASSLYGIIGAVVFGLIAYLVAFMFYSSQASSTITSQDFVDVTGTITVPIAPDGIGQISCVIKGRPTKVLAKTLKGSAIAADAIVKISKMEGDIAIVQQVDL